MWYLAVITGVSFTNRKLGHGYNWDVITYPWLSRPQAWGLDTWKSNITLVKLYCRAQRAQWIPKIWRICDVFLWKDPSIHYSGVIMSMMAFQTTSVKFVCSAVCWADQRKYQSSASLGFVSGIHRWLVDYPQKGQEDGTFFHLMTSSRYLGGPWKFTMWKPGALHKNTCQEPCHPCLSFIDVLAEPLVKLGYGWVIIWQKTMVCNYWPLLLSQVNYHQTCNIRHIFIGNRLANHSDVVAASPVGAAPTTSSFSTLYLGSIDWAKATARQEGNHLSFVIWCNL